MKVVKYEHHGRKVTAFTELKGKHRDHCLCMVCKKLVIGDPGDPEENCPIAQAVFDNAVKFGLCTPVYECPDVEIDEEKLAENPLHDLDEGERVIKQIEIPIELSPEIKEAALARARSLVVNDEDTLLRYAVEEALSSFVEMDEEERELFIERAKEEIPKCSGCGEYPHPNIPCEEAAALREEDDE